MTRPRKDQIAIKDTPYYHIVSRCVRRTYLCGYDSVSGNDYEHRRQWIENRIRLLSSIFTIDISAYAVMSNHIHLVVKLCPNDADNLSSEDVVNVIKLSLSGSFICVKKLQLHHLCHISRITPTWPISVCLLRALIN